MVRRPSLRHALAASLRRLRRRAESGLPAGEAGNIMIMMGLATVVLFGIMGLAIDVGRLYATKAELSRAALDLSVSFDRFSRLGLPQPGIFDVGVDTIE